MAIRKFYKKNGQMVEEYILVGQMPSLVEFFFEKISNDRQNDFAVKPLSDHELFLFFEDKTIVSVIDPGDRFEKTIIVHDQSFRLFPEQWALEYIVLCKEHNFPEPEIVFNYEFDRPAASPEEKKK